MFDRVTEILTDFTEMKKSEMTMDTALIADLGLNSLNVVTIVVAFEDEFDIEIPNKAIKSLRTIGDIVQYIEKHV